MKVLFSIKNKQFCADINKKLVTPNFMKKDEEVEINGKLLDTELRDVQIKLTCEETFLGEKKVHFRKARRNTRDRKKAKRTEHNLLSIALISDEKNI